MRELQAQPGALASLGPGRKGLPGNAPFQDSRTTMCVAALFIALPVAVGFCFCSPSHSLLCPLWFPLFVLQVPEFSTCQN